MTTYFEKRAAGQFAASGCCLIVLAGAGLRHPR